MHLFKSNFEIYSDSAIYAFSITITIFERLSGNCVRLASTNCNWFSLLTICPSTWLKRHAQNIIAFRFN